MAKWIQQKDGTFKAATNNTTKRWKQKKDGTFEEDIAPVKETTKKQSVNSLRDGAGTVNEDGYTYTGKNYGDYWYQNYATNKDDKIYSKDGMYFVYNEKRKRYDNVDQLSFMTTKEQDEKDYNEAKKMGFTGSKSALTKVSEKLKLDTADLTSKEYTEYEKDLLRQEEAKNKEYAHNNQVNYGGAGLKGAVGEIKTAFSNVANKVDKEIIAPIKNFSDNYETGKLNNQLALEYYKKMQGEENNADELAKKVEVYNSFNQDLINDAGATGTAIQQLNTQVESIKNQGIAATILSGVGAGIGAIATKTSQGAIAGAKAGAGIGYALGSTPYMYKLEAGNQYKALTDMGVPDDIAKKYSKITGGVNAAIESGENVVDIFTFGAAGKTASISKEAVGDMIDEYGESQVKQWLKNKVGEETAETIVKGVKVAGVSYLQNIGSEALEESLQETTSITTERLATNEAGIEREATLKDDLGRILESGVSAAISTAFTSPLTSLGGSIVTNTVNSVETKIASKKGKKITSSEINEVIRQNIEKENPNLTTQEVQQIQSEIFKELQNDGVEITDIQQSVENIDNQIIELEKQLETTENDAEYERISNQIRVLEEKANQLEQQDIAPVKTDEDTKKRAIRDRFQLPMQDNSSANNIVQKEKNVNLTENISPKEDIAPVKQNTIDYSAVKEEEILPYLEQENKGRMESITDKDAPIETTQEADYMPDTISVDKKSLNALSKNIKKELGLNKTQTTELESIIQEVSKSETATREDLKNTIQKRFSEQTIEHKNEELAEIKRDLRNRRIYVDDYLKSEFRDGFNKIRQQNFNKLKFTNDGTSVDSVYQELSEIYPAYFPNDINNAQDQLQRIVDVANEDVVDVENYVLPNETIQDVTDFVYDSINDYKLDQRVKMSEEARKSPIDESLIPPIQQELNDLTSEIKSMIKDTKKEIKSLKKEINGVKTDINEVLEDIAPVVNASNTQVNEDIAPIKVNDEGQGTLDLGIVKKLNAPEGEFKNKDVEPIDLDKAKQITIDGTEENLVTKTKKELRKALLGTEAQKEFILGALDNAKNRSMALMNNTDTIRNTELVFGRDAGSYINEVIFQKEIDNEADSIAWQNKERDEIKALGIKARSKESAAVQKYGEKQYVNDVGELVAYGDKELISEFSDVETQEKIKRAAQVIRNKYDNYIDRANEVLTKLGFDAIPKRKDYMRHFQELNDVFSRYGIPFNAQNMTEHVLPTDINGLTENWSPQKNYFANTQRRTGVKTTYDAITGVDGYIGGIANLIYHTEDIQRGRAFEELIRETYGEDKGFENLDNLPDELKQARAEKIQDNHLSNYAAWLHEWTNNVAGKKHKIDRSVESLFGRKAFSFLDGARKQVGSNMIGFNLSSSLTNLIAPIQATAKTNKLAVLKGTADTIKNMFVKDDFMSKNKFLTSRMGTDMISKNAWQKIQDAGFIFMKGMDWFSSNQIVRSKYYELRAKGMSEQQAHAEAGQFAARILGDRTKGANAQLYNSKLVGLVTQFQLEVNNQLYSQFYDTYHESKEAARGNALKTAAGMTFTLGQLFAFTHLFGQTFEAIAGYNPTFDVIDMLKTAFGWGEDDDEEKTTSERLKSAADQLVDALPYVNILTGGGRIPVASGIPNLVGVATGGKDQYGNELTLEDELKKLLFLVPPTGGNQVKKTTQGLSMFDEDLPISGSYTDSGNLRFPVEDTIQNRIQASLFGQYASENAGYYFDNNLAPLKEKQIEEFIEMNIPYKEYREYRKDLAEVNKTKADKDEDGKAISGTAAGKKAYQIMNGDYSKKEKERLLEGLSSETYKITTSDLDKLNNNEELYKYYFKLTTKGKSDFINAIKNYGFDAETLYEANNVIKNIEDNYSKLNDNGKNLTKQKKQAIKNAISQYTTTKAQYDYLYHRIYKK